MTTTLPRRNVDDIPETVFLRPSAPDHHRLLQELLPWMTPMFSYRTDNLDWVRWAVPRTVGERIGLSEQVGCECGHNCRAAEHDGGFEIDTAWHETGWWLEANGYALPTENPEKEGKK